MARYFVKPYELIVDLDKVTHVQGWNTDQKPPQFRIIAYLINTQKHYANTVELRGNDALKFWDQMQARVEEDIYANA